MEYTVGFEKTQERCGEWGEAQVGMTRTEAQQHLKHMGMMWPDAVLLKRTGPDQPWEKVAK